MARPLAVGLDAPESVAMGTYFIYVREYCTTVSAANTDSSVACTHIYVYPI
jgi:hypothetical protein